MSNEITESATALSSEPTKAATATRAKNPDATKKDILAAALKEFSRNGYSGARVDTIAEATQTSKRMIYYYFGGKERLFLAVLNECYKSIRAFEAELHLEDLPPIIALKKLVEATVDYQASNANFIRIIMSENIREGEHIRRLPELKAINSKAIELLEKICRRGQDEGVFRIDFDPIDLHMSISALSFFNVSNRHTFGFIFDRDFVDKSVHAARREQIVETILRFVRA